MYAGVSTIGQVNMIEMFSIINIKFLTHPLKLLPIIIIYLLKLCVLTNN